MNDLKTIFIVDDNDVNLLSAEEALSDDYRVFTLPSAESMFEFLEKVIPDVILLDIEMPVINGFEALVKLKDNPRFSDISVMFLTSRKDVGAEVRGFELGAIDFIHKPFTKPILIHRIKTHLHIDAIIHEQTKSLHKLKNCIVSALARVIEDRDDLTGRHIERTTMYIEILLKEMLKSGVYADEIKKWDLDSVILSSRLHDVGKVAISDLLLNKPGRLTIEEFAQMKKHTVFGYKILEKIKEVRPSSALTALLHHEKINGKGYPLGLKSDKIHIYGKTFMAADKTFIQGFK